MDVPIARCLMKASTDIDSQPLALARPHQIKLYRMSMPEHECPWGRRDLWGSRYRCWRRSN